MAKNKRKYRHVLATRAHFKIESLDQLDWRSTLGLFLVTKRGTYILGQGELHIKNKKQKFVHTDATWLHNHRRRQGHGIHLYFAPKVKLRNIPR